jgi:hypothetical protein
MQGEAIPTVLGAIAIYSLAIAKKAPASAGAFLTSDLHFEAIFTSFKTWSIAPSKRDER